jgi:predicted transposase YbfD/YdcC
VGVCADRRTGGCDRHRRQDITLSKGKQQAAIHMVSAFAARQRLVLGQVKVTDKSNEIVAIPKLLDLLHIEGAIVTIDAMGKAGLRFRQAQPDGMARQGCQHEIAQKIIDKGADYILALKGNQGRLREDVEVFATEQQGRGSAWCMAQRFVGNDLNPFWGQTMRT